MTNLNSIAGFGAGGGGGGSTEDALHNGTPVAEVMIDRTGHNDRKAQNHTSGLIPGASPNGNIKSRNVFATWAQWKDLVNNYTGFDVSSFSVDRSTGAITVLQGGAQNLWNNGGQGAATSTTYCSFDPVHGCFFSGGHNGYTSGSHQFGYTAGQITTTGAISGNSMSYSNKDHTRNGTYCGCLPQGTGTQYFMTGGYDGGNSMNGYRLHTAQASGISVGSWVQSSNWTSSGGPWSHIYQPDQTPNSGEVTSGVGSSLNGSSNYGWTLARGNGVSTISRAQGYSDGDMYQGAGGVPFIVQSTYSYGTMGNSSNSYTSLGDGTRDFGSHSMQMQSYGIHHVGIGQNKYLCFRPGDDAFNSRKDLVELIGIESNQNPKRLAHLTMGGATDSSILDSSSSINNHYIVFENDNDTYPKWLVQCTSSTTRYAKVQVFEITADFSAYTI